MLQFVKSMSRREKQAVMLGVDLALVPLALAFTLAVQGASGNPFGHLLSIGPVIGLIMVLAAALSIILGIPNTQLNAYDMSSVRKTALFACLLALASYALGTVSKLPYPTGVYVVFGLVFFLLSAGSRIAMLHILLTMYRRELPHCRVLIYGAGTTGIQLVQALKTHQAIEPVAFADDSQALQRLTISGLPVIKPSQIERVVAEKGIDRVLLAMPSLSAPKQTQIARRLQKMGLEVQALPSFAQLIGEEALIDKLIADPARPASGPRPAGPEHPDR